MKGGPEKLDRSDCCARSNALLSFMDFPKLSLKGWNCSLHKVSDSSSARRIGRSNYNGARIQRINCGPFHREACAPGHVLCLT